MRKSPWWILFVAAFVLIPLVAACGGAAPASPTQPPKAAATTAPAAAATSAPAAAATSAPAKPAANAPSSIKVGAVIPLTGRYAAGGAQVQAGYEFAVADINKAGGVMVKEFGAKIPLELKIQDDESDPSKTVSRLEGLTSSDHVVAYLGGFGSDLHAAGAAIGDKNKTPYLGVAFALQSIHEKGLKYLFSPFPKSPEITKNTVDLLNSIPADQRPKKVAIFQEKTDWGTEMEALWKKDLSAAGYQIVVDEQYAPGTTNYSDIILKAKSAGAEVLLALPNPPDGMAIIRQMKELGFSPKMTYMVRAADAPGWGQNLGKDGDFVALAPGWHYGAKFPGVQELNAQHQAKFGRPADVVTGPAYATVQVLADAISRADKLNGESIRDALTKTKVMTVIGEVSFRPDGVGNVQFITVQWIDGKQELIWPKEMATKPFAFPEKPFDQR